jgi:triphosphoribosyl-dephospho-CoA synthase
MYVRLEQCRDPVMMQDALMAWDAELKSAGINPGTSADLTVVTAFLANVLDWEDGRREEQKKKF